MGDVDVIGSGVSGTLFDLYPGNGYYIDMDGDQDGTITTTSSFLLTPGTTYTFSFDLGKNATLPESMAVSLSSAYSEIFSDLGGPIPTLTPVSRTLTVAAPTTVDISFASNTPGRAGYVIDNVSLVAQQGGATAPEPGNLALLGVVGEAGLCASPYGLTIISMMRERTISEKWIFSCTELAWQHRKDSKYKRPRQPAGVFYIGEVAGSTFACVESTPRRALRRGQVVQHCQVPGRRQKR